MSNLTKILFTIFYISLFLQASQVDVIWNVKDKVSVRTLTQPTVNQPLATTDKVTLHDEHVMSIDFKSYCKLAIELSKKRICRFLDNWLPNGDDKLFLSDDVLCDGHNTPKNRTLRAFKEDLFTKIDGLTFPTHLIDTRNPNAFFNLKRAIESDILSTVQDYIDTLQLSAGWNIIDTSIACIPFVLNNSGQELVNAIERNAFRN